jgi:hypothetical protein
VSFQSQPILVITLRAEGEYFVILYNMILKNLVGEVISAPLGISTPCPAPFRAFPNPGDPPPGKSTSDNFSR